MANHMLLALQKCVSICMVVACCWAMPVVAANASADRLRAEQRQSEAVALYASARQQLVDGSYADGLASLQRLVRSHPDFNQLTDVQTRIAVLREPAARGAPLEQFLQALDHREAGDTKRSIRTLEELADQYPQSALYDDALYLLAYVQVLDAYAFDDALRTLATLLILHPASSYRDSAEYLQAIALEQLGDTEAARASLRRLKRRHTAVQLPFGLDIPVGEVMSRYWYDRAAARLAIIEQRLSQATVLKHRTPFTNQSMEVKVNVAGMDLTLQLVRSSLLDQASFRDATLNTAIPPSVGVYMGKVADISDSWVRAVIDGDRLHGVLMLGDERHDIVPADLVGTLDYYQPYKHHAEARRQALGEARVAPLPVDEAVMPLSTREQKSLKASYLNSRVVPLSIVVDSRFDAYHAGRGLATALDQLNVADGIYRELGISLTLDEALVFDDAGDPMKTDPVALESLLRTFRDWRLGRQEFFNESATVYLFTGNRTTDITLGLAWIDTLCRTDGYDVGVTTPNVIGDVLLTHELGHTLGARHDSETACNSDSTQLMWPNISERTQTRFSQCSSDVIRMARQKSCLLDGIDLGLTLTGVNNAIEVRVQDNSPASALQEAASAQFLQGEINVETSVSDLIDWPVACTVLTPKTASCRIDFQLDNEPVMVLPLRPADSHEAPIVTAQLELENVVETYRTDNTVSVAINRDGGIEAVAVNEPLPVADPEPNVQSAGAAATSGWLGVFALMGLAFRRCRKTGVAR